MRVVGDRDRLVVGVVGGDGQHRAEDLLLGHLRIRVDVGQQRGLRVVADRQVLRDAAAGDQSGARVDAALDQAEHLLPLRLADLRALHVARRPRIADREAFHHGLEDLDALVIAAARQQDPARQDAGLPATSRTPSSPPSAARS